MRILFDSQQLCYKDPFGTLTPDQDCVLHIHIPGTVNAIGAQCVFTHEDGTEAFRFPMTFSKKHGPYDVFRCSFRLDTCGLYYYYFSISKADSTFRLFKQGHDTNMEAGDCWQLSCIPADFSTPDWAKGAVIYQVFPDRFHKSGNCDVTGKLKPYTLHSSWEEEVSWQPTLDGVVLNNDFYGGNFRGITEKMDYIASLGTTILYLNPISKSFSSHRYDTGDYKTPDPLLGTAEDFRLLCQAAHAYGIRVILDGVYSHTGSNSLYFDKEGTFGGQGAYRNPNSPYRSWYRFHHYPDTYESWWGFDTLPTVNKLDPAFVEYIITGEDSVVAHWLRLGADGFRLDVVDELPNEFVLLLKQRIRELKPDALLIGEVWEDASCKIAYGIRRRYFVDGVLDSCMNYPFRTAILDFLRGSDDGKQFRQTVMTIAENYPSQVLHCNMNLLGTHDTPRILTALMGECPDSREAQARHKLSPEALETAVQRLQMAAFLQYTLPGAPSLYYGDEAGMEGCKDPFNRRTFPWGKENQILSSHFRILGQLRKYEEALRTGDLAFFKAESGQIGFSRTVNSQRLMIYVNRRDVSWEIPAGRVLMSHNLNAIAPTWLELKPMGYCIIKE